MLGFSQYSQVSYIAIIEQKIRVFFLAVFTVSPRLAGLLQDSLKSSGTLQSSVIEGLFALFAESLRVKNLYEEYLLPSVFISDVNYDFVTNEDPRTFKLAEKNFRDTFFRVLKEVLEAPIDISDDAESPTSAFLNALLVSSKIRNICPYIDEALLRPSTNPLVEVGKPISSLFQDDSSKDSNCFYLETFFRIKKSVAGTMNLSAQEIKRGQFLSKVELGKYLADNKIPGTQLDNFTKGIRLMMNLTSLIAYSPSAVVTPAANINLPAYNKMSLRVLPFLDTDFLTQLGEVCVFDRTDRNYYRLPKNGAAKYSPLNPTNPSYLKAEEVIARTKDAISLSVNKADDATSFTSSKSLVCVEDLGSSLAVYLPICVSEFISEKYNTTQLELCNGLSSTTTYNEFFATTNVAEILQLVRVLARFFTLNPVDFFDASNNSSIKNQNDALDNMITNLINFDEV